MMKQKLLFEGSLLLVVVLAFSGNVTHQEAAAQNMSKTGAKPYIFAEGWELNLDNPGYPLPSGIIVEKDIRVAMRDGCELSCNVYRPNKSGRFPVLLSFTVYHKDLSGWAASKGVKAQVSRETAFEAMDPGFWVLQDYVVILFDERGYGLSEGVRLGARNGEDYYDGIEWAAAQPWSNGNIGMNGVSALANCSWSAASAQPPSLKAISVWEGFGAADAVDHNLGPRYWGITEFQFGRQMVWWIAPLNPALGQSNPAVRTPSKIYLEKITIPALICVSHDQELHAMGGMWGYEHISSKYKWFYSHGRHKWDVFYGAEALAFQKMFFDCFLKDDRNSGILDTPRVRMEVRDTRDKYYVNYENDWPIARTQYKKLYLDATTGTLSFNEVRKEGKVTYDSGSRAAVFSVKFDEDTQITGNIGAYLWVSPDEVNDMDLLVKLRKLNAEGKAVYFDHCHAPGTYEVASGWWRLSWRELDKNKSRPEWPIPAFGTPQKVNPGDVVRAAFNIYFSSTLFHKDETLQMFIAGSNKYSVTNNRFMYDFLNFGSHTIYTGGNHDSYLLIPVLPSLTGARASSVSPNIQDNIGFRD
jgi:predicted acyl esterase